MRSDNIIKALDTGQNRFELCHQAFKAVRKLHNPGNRIQDTTNDALQRLVGVARQEVSVEPGNTNEATLEVRQGQVAIKAQSGAPQAELISDLPLIDPSILLPAEGSAIATELSAANR
jgi:hypothetical protein